MDSSARTKDSASGDQEYPDIVFSQLFFYWISTYSSETKCRIWPDQAQSTPNKSWQDSRRVNQSCVFQGRTDKFTFKTQEVKAALTCYIWLLFRLNLDEDWGRNRRKHLQWKVHAPAEDIWHNHAHTLFHNIRLYTVLSSWPLRRSLNAPPPQTPSLSLHLCHFSLSLFLLSPLSLCHCVEVCKLRLIRLIKTLWEMTAHTNTHKHTHTHTHAKMRLAASVYEWWPHYVCGEPPLWQLWC